LVEVDKVEYIIGPACGSPQEAIAPLVKEKDVLVLLPSAATRSLHELSDGKMYNVQYSLEEESKYIAEKMYEMGYKKVALISYKNAFSMTHVESFKKHYKGEIVEDIVFQDATADISTEVAKLRNSDIDSIFSTDMSFFFAQGITRLEQFGIDVPVFSQYAVELPAARQFVEGVTYSFPGDLGDQGAVAELAKLSAKTFLVFLDSCQNDFRCVIEEFAKSAVFDSNGIRIQPIVLKQISGGEPVVVE